MYELIEWEGQRTLIPTVFDFTYLDPESEEAILYGKTTASDEDEIIDILDFTVSKDVKKAEKQHYAFAAISGMLSYVANYLFVGKNTVFDLNKELTRKDFEFILKQLMAFYPVHKLTDAEIEKHLTDATERLEAKVNNAPEYVNLAFDFASGLSVKSLMVSIISQVLNIRVGIDEQGRFAVVELSEEERSSGLYAGIMLGFIKWLFNAAAEYRSTGKFTVETEDLIKLKESGKHLKTMIAELSKTDLLNSKDFEKTEMFKWLTEKINAQGQFNNNEQMPLGKLFLKQEIPVQINRCLVLGYLLGTKLMAELKNKSVKQIKGLRYIEFTDLSDEKAILDRMHTVSTGVFTILNTTHAAGAAALAGAKTAEMGPPAAAVAGMVEFASWMNFANCIELVTVIRAEKEYLTEDIRKAFEVHQKATHERKKIKPDITLKKFTMLNNIETKILYSLELQLIEDDISNTKNNNTQILKGNWKEEWKAKSIEAVGLQKLFMEDKEKLFAMIVTHANSGSDNSWLYRILLELKLFKPYYQLNLEKPDKDYEKLKLVNDKYVENSICNFDGLNPYLGKNEVKNLMNNYQKNYDLLDKKLLKGAAGTAGTIAATAVAAGMAYAFAPVIAVYLVGGSLAGLSGAALTSASLALLGGGSLAAGGLGMAGGAVVIAGGGALVGLGSSGITAAAITLMSSPKYVHTDFAKLLTNCNYILLGKYNQIENVKSIQEAVDKELNNMRFQTVLIEERADVEKKRKKELIKNLEESIRIYEMANEQLKKMIGDYLRKHN